MIFDKQGTTTTITRESVSLDIFLTRLKDTYDTLKHDDLIVNLFSLKELTAEDIRLFLEISNAHRKRKRSFVIVTTKITYDQVPDELIVVPTIQEAHDIIEMEAIERDLGF